MASGKINRTGLISKTFTVSNVGGTGAVLVPSSASVPDARVVSVSVKGITNDSRCIGIYFEYGAARTPFVKVVDWETLDGTTNQDVEITLYYL